MEGGYGLYALDFNYTVGQDYDDGVLIVCYS